MKKELITISIFLLLIPLISSAEIQMKNNFSSQETLIAKISGNFQTPILKENIVFYRGHVKVPMDYEVGKINNDYYVYAMLPTAIEPSNYSISIENVKYLQGTQISEDKINKDFIIFSKKANFTINPGFVIAKDDFFITIQNLENNEIYISINVKKETPESKGFFDSLFGFPQQDETSILVKSGEIKKVDFSLQDFTQSEFETIKLSTKSLVYEIPIYIFINQTEEKLKGFRFEPTQSDISMTVNSQKTKIIYLYNIGQIGLDNIELSVSDSLNDYISLSRYNIDKLEQNSNIVIELNIKSGQDKSVLQGEIFAKTLDSTVSIPITLNFLKSTEEVPADIDNYILIPTCKELNGTVCSSSQTCSGKEETASDEKCCLAKCTNSDNSTTLKIAGFLIILAVIAVVYWFFVRKYFKAR